MLPELFVAFLKWPDHAQVNFQRGNFSSRRLRWISRRCAFPPDIPSF